MVKLNYKLYELEQFAERQGKEGIERYWHKKNQQSIDGFKKDIVRRLGIKVIND